MKHISLVIAFFCTLFFSHAQVIQGTVYDSKTRETLPGVVVYLDGTSVVTTSDNDGKFLLVVKNKINANLVFSHLSYESLVVEKPFEHHGETFFLKEKTNLLHAAVAVAEYDPYRAERMRVFKNFFLGESVAAKSCVILNEDDIVLRYDHPLNMLYAFAYNPLIVENRYLGYRIIIDIQYFQVEYTYTKNFVTIPSSFSYRISYFFEDQAPYDISLIRRRNEIYERSRQYFWSSLIRNYAQKESGFKIYNKFKEVDSRDYFVVSDSPAQEAKMVLLRPDTDINRKHSKVSEENVYGVISIRSRKNNVSEVIFTINRFSVDLFGNIVTSGIVYQGDMANQRVGDLLPRDFVYTPQNSFRPSISKSSKQKQTPKIVSNFWGSFLF
jgi:hypothetical protein